MAEKGMLTINFNNGTVEKYEYNREEDTFSVGAKIKEVAGGTMLIIGLEDKTLFIPYSSIQCVEVSPSPAKLPDTAVKGARKI
jgi:hypothetical protein